MISAPFASVQRCCRGCGSRAANRLGGAPAKLRTASAKRCVRSSAAAASLTMRLLHGRCGIGSKTEVRGRASNLSRPTVSSVGKNGSHGASWLAQRVECHPPFFAEYPSALAIGSEQRSSSPPRYEIGECLRSRPINLTGAKKYFEQRLAVGDYYAESERVVGQLDRQRRGVAGPSRCCCSTRLRSLCENNDPRTGTRLTQRLKTTRTVDDGPDNEHQAANQSDLYDFTFSPPKSISIAPRECGIFLPNEYGLAFVVGLLVSVLIQSNGRALVRVLFRSRLLFFAPTNVGGHGLPKAFEKRCHREK